MSRRGVLRARSRAAGEKRASRAKESPPAATMGASMSQESDSLAAGPPAEVLGATASFEAAVEAVRGPARRFARRLVGATDGEDVASAAVLAVCERFRGGAPPRRPTSFALSVVWNKAADLRRRRPAASFAEVEGREGPPVQAPDPSRAAEMRDWLEAGLRRLAADDRAVLHLRYVEDLDYAEIAKVLGASVGAVGRRLHEARRRLARALDASEGDARIPAAFLPLLRAGDAAGAAPVWTTGIGAAAVVGLGSVLMSKLVAVAALVAALVVVWTRFGGGPTPAPVSANAPSAASAGLESASTTRKGETDAVEGPVVARTPFEPVASAVQGKVWGRVFDARGAPRAGAKVVVAARLVAARFSTSEGAPSGATTGVSDAVGAFEIVAPKEGASFDVLVEVDGGAPACVEGLTAATCPWRIVVEDPLTLTGYVRDASDAAVAGAEVSVRAPLGRAWWRTTTRTLADGSYRLDAPGGVRTRLFVAAEGYAPQQREIDGAGGGERREDVWLARGAVVRGVVLAAGPEGAPIADAEVVLWTSEGGAGISRVHGVPRRNVEGGRILARTRSDAGGKFVFEHVPVRAGGARFAAYGVGGRMGGVVATASGKAAAGRVVPLREKDGDVVEVVVVLPPAATVKGRIVDTLGRPVRGVRVSAGERATVGRDDLLVPGETGPFGGWAVVDEDGRFDLPFAPAAPDGSEQETTLNLCGCDVGLGNQVARANLRAGATTDVGDVVFGPALRRVSGAVVNEAGEPVPGAVVAPEAPATGRAVEADVDGRFEVDVAAPPAPSPSVDPAGPASPPFRPRLGAFAAGVGRGAAEVPAEGDVRIALTPEGSRSPRLPAPSSGPILFLLRCEETTGEPFRNGVAVTPRAPEGAQTIPVVEPNGPGRFLVRGRIEGPCVLDVAAAGRLRERVRIDPHDGEPREIVVRLRRGGTVAGRLTVAGDGTPRRALVVARRLDGVEAGASEAAPGVVGSDGRYRIEALASGAWSVAAHAWGGEKLAALPVRVEIVEGVAEIVRDLRLDPAAELVVSFGEAPRPADEGAATNRLRVVGGSGDVYVDVVLGDEKTTTLLLPPGNYAAQRVVGGRVLAQVDVTAPGTAVLPMR